MENQIENQDSRTEILLGKEALKKIKQAKVLIFGLGGVGSYVVEGLVRAGISDFILVDNDKISKSNINRQIIATHKQIGKYKVDVEKERILEINPNTKVETYKDFFLKDEKNIITNKVDYIIDAIDTISAKLEIIKKANDLEIPIISSMGTGNKLKPEMFEITDINKTSVCPVAKIIRKELRNLGIKKLKVIYSKEEPIKTEEFLKTKKNGTVSFVPSVAGLMIAGEVIKDIIK